MSDVFVLLNLNRISGPLHFHSEYVCYIILCSSDLSCVSCQRLTSCRSCLLSGLSLTINSSTIVRTPNNGAVYDHMVDLESRSKKQVQTAAEVTSFLVDT
jgi:hypothetical protein